MEINKRHFIYMNITQIDSHNKIIDFLKDTNTKYTENKNGIFLNLNTIEDNKIDHIYLIVNEIMLNIYEGGDLDPKDECEYEMNEIVLQKEEKKDDLINHNDIFLSSFSKKDQEIIQYSKLYL